MGGSTSFINYSLEYAEIMHLHWIAWQNIYLLNEYRHLSLEDLISVGLYSL
jgi:hypothetical protein